MPVRRASSFFASLEKLSSSRRPRRAAQCTARNINCENIGMDYRNFTGRISRSTSASLLDETIVFITVNEITRESLPLASQKTVSFTASKKSLRKLSKSEPYGRSEGNLSGGKRKVAFNTHASVTRGW